MVLLVGDNPFHGVSHLSQKRARERGGRISKPTFASQVVKKALKSGTEGFMFTESDKTLSILKRLQNQKTKLYCITPYPYDLFRTSTAGGNRAVINNVLLNIIASKSLKSIFQCLEGVSTINLESLLKSFVNAQVSKLKSTKGKKQDRDGDAS